MSDRLNTQTDRLKTQTDTIRVFVADDHPVVREGVIRILSRFPDLNLVGEAATTVGLLPRVNEANTDVLLLDIQMPGPGWLDSLRQLSQQAPAVRALILSFHPEEEFGLRALRAGAAGYLQKGCPPEKLAYSIRQVNSKGRAVSFSLASRWLETALTKKGALASHEGLSQREYEVFAGLIQGKSNKEISYELGLSPKTVTTYRSRILIKLRLDNNAGLIRYAMSHGLLPT